MDSDEEEEEELVYVEDEEIPIELIDEEPEQQKFIPTYGETQHIEKETIKPSEGATANIGYVKKYVGTIPSNIETEYDNKISQLNSRLLKEVVDRKTVLEYSGFNLEQYRYYRFLEFLSHKCKKNEFE
jgi:hypothetical protein